MRRTAEPESGARSHVDAFSICLPPGHRGEKASEAVMHFLGVGGGGIAGVGAKTYHRTVAGMDRQIYPYAAS